MTKINSTRNYHRSAPVDLLTEYTICESLSDPASPYLQALVEAKPYGMLLGGFLKKEGLLKTGGRIMEVGGGYGSLMAGLLQGFAADVKLAVMADLSPHLLRRQAGRLGDWPAKTAFVRLDIHQAAFKNLDLIIMNEVLGDLDVITGVDPRCPDGEAAELIGRFGLEIPDQPFNLNSGAVRLVDFFCRLGVPVFLSEHACDPLFGKNLAYLAQGLDPVGFPREISLHRHSEYNIRFSHLEQVARSNNRRTLSGPLSDVVRLKASHELRFIFTARACSTERQEHLGELLDHIREYRYLIIY